MSEIKLCKDCKHFIWPETSSCFDGPHCKRVVWPVWGIPKECHEARSERGDCGKDAALHEYGPQPMPDHIANPKPWWRFW